MAKVEHVVADSAAFIKNAALRDIGVEVVTVREVVAEIRDKATRQRLQVLPYELKFREPSTDSIRIVTEFSKKTGDYRALSAVDIRVMALAYQLEKEHCGAQHLKVEPDRNITWQTSRQLVENPTEIAGFYLKSGKTTPSQSRTTSVCESHSSDVTTGDVRSRVEGLVLSEEQESVDNFNTKSGSDNIKPQAERVPEGIQERLTGCEDDDNRNLISSENNLNLDSSPCENITDSVQTTPLTSDCNSTADTNDKTHLNEPSGDSVNLKDSDLGDSQQHTEEVGDARGMVSCMGDGDILPTSCLRDDVSDESDDVSDDDDDDDDEEGWITPDNIKQMRARMGDRNTEQARVKVACLTTDFAMQNVLLQMGLHVISVEGMLIRRARSYVLRCYACFKISTDTTRMFCGHCGNSTLQRVSMSTGEDGSVQYFLSTRKPMSAKGKKFSLPAPRGGKYAHNPILVPDQREAQQRGTRASRVKYDVMDADYVTRTSPFAPHDTHSRAAQLGFNRWGKRNQGGGGGKSKQGRRR